MGSHEYGQSDEKPDYTFRVAIRHKLAVRVCLASVRNYRKDLAWTAALGCAWLRGAIAV
jgi:hypothetical protein